MRLGTFPLLSQLFFFSPLILTVFIIANETTNVFSIQFVRPSIGVPVLLKRECTPHPYIGFTAFPSNFHAIDKPSLIDHIYKTAVTFNDTKSKFLDNNATTPSLKFFLIFSPAFPVFQERARSYADFEYGR